MEGFFLGLMLGGFLGFLATWIPLARRLKAVDAERLKYKSRLLRLDVESQAIFREIEQLEAWAKLIRREP